MLYCDKRGDCIRLTDAISDLISFARNEAIKVRAKRIKNSGCASSESVAGVD